MTTNRSIACPKCNTFKAGPEGSICRNCEQEARVFIEQNTPHNMLPKSSKPILGTRGAERRAATAQLAAKARTFGTKEGFVGGSHPHQPQPATPSTPVATPSAPGSTTGNDGADGGSPL